MSPPTVNDPSTSRLGDESLAGQSIASTLAVVFELRSTAILLGELAMQTKSVLPGVRAAGIPPPLTGDQFAAVPQSLLDAPVQ